MRAAESLFGGGWMLLVIGAAQSYLAGNRLLAYLRYFQQENYYAGRFLKWAKLRSLTDPAFWLAVACLVLQGFEIGLFASLLFVSGALVLAIAQPDPTGTGKVRLRLTWRATRIFIVAVIVASLIWLAILLPPLGHPNGTMLVFFHAFLGAAVVYVLAPLLLILANGLLAPYEQYVQNSYENEAADRIRNVAPFIIGITGSYGKSSSKSMLAHMLQYKAPTLAASGSVNTLMGLTRHIREELVPGHRFMVVEMGAFNIGSIRRLCQLAPPSAGLITAVGDMHLERFGSTDAIVQAKSELAQAIPPGGLLVVNADSPGALRIARSATHCRVLLYGETSTEDLETRLEAVSFSKKGTTFVLRTRGGSFSCFTPLVGRPIVLNLAGAFTLATSLGVDPDISVASMRTLRPVSNRLELVEERGVTWIRDAYNSNQFGFRAALEVAAALPASRRFIATPGVIELGPQQFEVNRALSKEAAAVCDATIIVSEANRDAFVRGHHEAGRDAALVAVPGRREAFQWLRDTLKEGDAVILENDLPDLYERASGLFWNDGERRPS